jgi:hypothetical protein
MSYTLAEAAAAPSDFAECCEGKGRLQGPPANLRPCEDRCLEEAGKGATEIARAVGCQRGNVYKTLKAAGLN